MFKGWSDCGNRREKRKDVREEEIKKRHDHRQFFVFVIYLKELCSDNVL